MNSRSSRIGPYALVRRLAIGGMAEVFLARQDRLGRAGREVVIKRIREPFSDDPEFIAMFLDEARLVARLSHPNIIAVHEFGQEGSSLYLVMEYLEGINLASAISRTRRRGLDAAQALRIAAELCSGLHYVHSLRDDEGGSLDIVHRDVCPHNVLLGTTGEVKLIDFGIAKAATQAHATRPGILKGRLAYMAPESVRGQRTDHRIDVYAVGVVLWEMLAGRWLFLRENLIKSVEAVLNYEPPSVGELRPGLPAGLDAIITRAIAKDPEARYQSCADLQADLEALALGAGLTSSTMALGRYICDYIQPLAEDDSPEDLKEPGTAPSPSPVTLVESQLSARFDATEPMQQLETSSPSSALNLEALLETSLDTFANTESEQTNTTSDGLPLALLEDLTSTAPDFSSSQPPAFEPSQPTKLERPQAQKDEGPTKVERPQAEPAQIEPAQIEPAQIEPALAEPHPAEPLFSRGTPEDVSAATLPGSGTPVTRVRPNLDDIVTSEILAPTGIHEPPEPPETPEPPEPPEPPRPARSELDDMVTNELLAPTALVRRSPREATDPMESAPTRVVTKASPPSPNVEERMDPTIPYPRRAAAQESPPPPTLPLPANSSPEPRRWQTLLLWALIVCGAVSLGAVIALVTSIPSAARPEHPSGGDPRATPHRAEADQSQPASREPLGQKARAGRRTDGAVDNFHSAFLSVRSEPPGAHLWIDGQPTREWTGISELPVDPGAHTLELVLVGYRRWREEIVAAPGQRLSFRATLRPSTSGREPQQASGADVGLLDLSSTPRARVFLRGRSLGQTPLGGLELPAGTHSLDLLWGNHERAQRAVTIQAGRTTRHHFDLAAGAE